MGLSQNHFQRLVETFPLTGGAVRPERRYEPRRRSPTGEAVQPGAQVLSAAAPLTGGAVQPEHRRDPVSTYVMCVIGVAWVCPRAMHRKGSESFSDLQRLSETFRDFPFHCLTRTQVRASSSFSHGRGRATRSIGTECWCPSHGRGRSTRAQARPRQH